MSRAWERVCGWGAERAGLVAAALCCALVFVLGGCTLPRAAPIPFDESVDPALWAAFSPVSVRISSLTRVEAGAGGPPRLVLYFELLDAWGDSTKSPGWLQVELYGVAGVAAEREQRWELDLTDPATNSAFFDVTGMYRVPLEEAPAWLADAAAEDRPRALRIWAFYRTVGPSQTLVDLRDSFERSL